MPSRQQYDRTDRISEELRRELDGIIRDELHDPRISGTWSLTRVEVTRDLRYAKVFVSVLEDERRTDLLNALKHAGGYLRRAVSKQMIIRQSPELQFVEDHNIEYGAHIASVLGKVLASAPAQAQDGDDDAQL